MNASAISDLERLWDETITRRGNDDRTQFERLRDFEQGFRGPAEAKPIASSFGILNKQQFIQNVLDLEAYSTNNPDGFKSFKYVNGNNHFFIIETNPLVLEGVALGAFRLKFRVLDTLNYGGAEFDTSVVISSLNPVRQDFPHPHVSREKLCWGDYKSQGHAALVSRNPFKFFQIVLGILNTYNPESPFAKLESYMPSVCDECFNTGEDRNMRHCRFCITKTCMECSMLTCALCRSFCCRDCSYKVFHHSNERDSKGIRSERIKTLVACKFCYQKHPITFSSGGFYYRAFFATTDSRSILTRPSWIKRTKELMLSTSTETPTLISLGDTYAKNLNKIPLQQYYDLLTGINND